MNPSRPERLQELIEKHGSEQESQGTLPTADGRYALIETSRAHDWLTVFDTPDEAMTYHFDQEYASDWSIVGLMDLDTGVVYDDYRVEAHFIMDAPVDHRPWDEVALAAVKWCTETYEEFTTDEVWDRVEATALGVTPRGPKAMGAVMTHASHAGWITRTGRTKQSANPRRRRAARVTLWQAVKERP